MHLDTSDLVGELKKAELDPNEHPIHGPVGFIEIALSYCKLLG